MEEAMTTDLQKAAELLSETGYTCVLCKGEAVLTSAERGVKPLLQWLDAKTDLRGFSAADKVVGRAAAFLYVLLGVQNVYAPVMSEQAREVLLKNGVEVVCSQIVKAIRNRTNTGFCPMEEAVRDTSDPQKALTLIQKKLQEMNRRG